MDTLYKKICLDSNNYGVNELLIFTGTTAWADAELVPNNFEIVYGVANSDERIHDIANSFGWVQQDKAEDF